MAIDWTKVRMEYLSTECTYRDLASKYGIALSNIAKKAKKEDWQGARETHRNKIGTKAEQKTIEKTSETLAEYAARQTADLVKINELLIGKVYETMAYGDAFSPRDLKSLSGMLADLMMNRKSMMDEQNAGAGESDKVTVEFVKPYWEGGDA